MSDQSQPTLSERAERAKQIAREKGWLVDDGKGHERFIWEPNHGSAREVLDYVAWIWHCQRVHDLCDSTETALAAFDSFERSASAERGKHVRP